MIVPITDEERAALARAALGEVVDPAEVGDLIGAERPEPGVVDLRFACTLAAYTGWSWVVSTSDLEGVEPTVLEVELLPGDGALLAPPWVPWAERLAEWRRQHPDERHPGEVADDETAEDDQDDEDREDDDAELDEEDLADDDGLDELDDAELEGALSPEEAEQDTGDVDDEDPEPDEADDDDRAPRPAEEDRSL
ncbi:DUF3027 domain-containing protein [Amnibacterium setariae]|uniref:DUF3027 domain-containing protein n=1 Tax=Amnibacterium setariae TaxID=2306585 RepID=A0A3A1UB13_9MICO|nr:DUF3027 domain-containing protein [Amnibacterium setariae]